MSPRSEPRRRSRLADAVGVDVRLLVADLHNHTLLSDGRGDPEHAYQLMREAGLDVAALTDHSSIPADRLPLLTLDDYPDAEALAIGRLAPRSIDEAAWKRTGELADAFDVPGEFTAVRGFEWTEPWLGHVNVWFSDTYLPVTTPGRIDGLHDFLAENEQSALFGYNHPGREPGRLGGFAVPAKAPELADRMVGLEAFNRTHDFLFEGWGTGRRSPIADCLDAGWRPGLIGCSDEHGRTYGLAGKGRTGLWAPAHSRQGVREALRSRRTFATREVGLRVDATLDGVPMGGRLRAGRQAELALDTGGSAYAGRAVEVQLLAGSRERSDGGIRVVDSVDVTIGEIRRATVTVPDDSPWTVLRLADPGRPHGGPVPHGHPARGWALAYASPWYLR